jgi:hypothetical protein
VRQHGIVSLNTWIFSRMDITLCHEQRYDTWCDHNVLQICKAGVKGF